MALCFLSEKKVNLQVPAARVDYCRPNLRPDLIIGRTWAASAYPQMEPTGQSWDIVRPSASVLRQCILQYVDQLGRPSGRP